MAYRTYRYYNFPRYVSVAEKEATARKVIESLKKKGIDAQPVLPFKGRIASSFWGKCWCDCMESYADYENRLDRGKSYLRHGTVCHLVIDRGKVNAVVSGSSPYNVSVVIDEIEQSRINKLEKLVKGKVSSQLDLLLGKFPKEIQEVIGAPYTGIIPFPKEIKFTCSCPDIASMCKHVAAVLYAIGRRIDSEPGLLFTLRGLPPDVLCSMAADVNLEADGGEEALTENMDLGNLLGIDLGEGSLEGIEAGTAAPEDSKPADTGADSEKKTSAAKKSRGRPKKTALKDPAVPDSKETPDQAISQSSPEPVDSTTDVVQGSTPEPGKELLAQELKEGDKQNARGTRGQKTPSAADTGDDSEKTTSAAKKSRGRPKKTALKDPAVPDSKETPDQATSQSSPEPVDSTTDVAQGFAPEPGKELITDQHNPPTVLSSGPAASSQAQADVDAATAQGTAQYESVITAAEAAMSAAAQKSGENSAPPTSPEPFDKNNPTAEGIQELMRLSNCSAEDFAWKVGVGQQTIQRWIESKGSLALRKNSVTKLVRFQTKLLKKLAAR